jgi:hypothetical protein
VGEGSGREEESCLTHIEINRNNSAPIREFGGFLFGIASLWRRPDNLAVLSAAAVVRDDEQAGCYSAKRFHWRI